MRLQCFTGGNRVANTLFWGHIINITIWLLFVFQMYIISYVMLTQYKAHVSLEVNS